DRCGWTRCALRSLFDVLVGKEVPPCHELQAHGSDGARSALELADRYAEGLVIGAGSWKDRAHQIGTKWQGANPRRGGNPGDRPGLQDRFPGSKALSSRAEVLELHDAHHALPDAAGLAHQRKAAGND